jgi:CIC family chloride channel protein
MGWFGETVTAAGQVSAAQSELQEFLRFQNERHRLFPRALVVGIVAGLVGVSFRAALAGGDAFRGRWLGWIHALPLGWLVAMVACALAAALSVWLVRRFAPEASGSGIPHLEAVLHRHRDLDWRRLIPIKFLGGVLALGSGMALGREGPTVQMGGAAGLAVSRLFRAGTREGLVLAAAGAGAGLAAAFNAPLAGLVFVLEELQRDFRANVFGAAFVAAAAADVVSRLFSGQLPVFSVPAYPTPPLAHLPGFAALGVVAGILGVGFNHGLIASVNGFGRIPHGRRVLAAGIVGAAVGLLAYFVPEAVGSGHGLAEGALAAKVGLAVIPAFFLLRFVLTMACYGTGAPGGIFAPLLSLGALIGLGTGELVAWGWPGAAIQPGTFAVVGMAAYFTGIVRAPLTGTVLIVEMTSSYALMLPLLVACLCAYAVAESLRDMPIYERLLQRDLRSGGAKMPMGEPMVLEIEVKAGAAFDGCSVRGLGLPPGVILVGCRDGNHEWVPDADTILQAPVRLTAVVSPAAENGLEILREGCDGR